MLFQETDLVLQDLEGSFPTHGHETDMEEQSDQPVFGDLVLHHQKRFSRFEAPLDFVEGVDLCGALQLVEGMGSGDGAEHSAFERQPAAFRLDQADLIIAPCFLAGRCKHSRRKIEPYNQSLGTHPPGQRLEGRPSTRADVEHAISRFGARLFGQNVAQHTLLVAGVQGDKPVIEFRKQVIIFLSEFSHGSVPLWGDSYDLQIMGISH